MKVIKEQVGNTTIFIQAIDDQLVVHERDGRATQPTGIELEFKDTYETLKMFLNDIAVDIGNVLDRIDASVNPKNVELEFNVGFSIGGGIVCLSGEAEYGMKVRMTWELDKKRD